MAICSQHGRRIPKGANAEFLLDVGIFYETNAGMKGYNMFWRITAILILPAFYSIYIGKMLLQKKQGI